MVLGILKFNATALEVLQPEYTGESETVAEYLTRNRYPLAFQRLYLYPLLSCIWIHDPEKDVGLMPIIFVVHYLWNHQLLYSISRPLTWYTIAGGAKQYVDKVLENVGPCYLHKNCPIRSVIREKDKVTLCFTGKGFAEKKSEDFTHVIFATHPVEILKMLGENLTPKERSILEKFHTTAESQIVLHSDSSFINKSMRSAWNFHDFSQLSSSPRVSLTADLKYIMGLGDMPGIKDMEILATMNPCRPVNSDRKFSFQHPAYDASTTKAQSQMAEVQGIDRFWYAGAWLGHGFHEDGFSKGIEVANQLCSNIEEKNQSCSAPVCNARKFVLKGWTYAAGRPHHRGGFWLRAWITVLTFSISCLHFLNDILST